MEGWKDPLWERSRKPPPGPDGKALTAVSERSGLWAVVVAWPIALREKVSRLLNDTLFIPRVPDIYFEHTHHTPGAQTEENKAQLRKLYDLILDTNRLLPIVNTASTTLTKLSNPSRPQIPTAPPTPHIEKEPNATIAPLMNHEECPMIVIGPKHGTKRRDYCGFSQRYERPSDLQRPIEESFKNHQDIEYSYVASHCGLDHRTCAKNNISPIQTTLP
ncbi:hypothetical protein HOY80DRAFT_1074288 [Tuber brumale]|nr:hypothetical protein HOY80DRAFT_1074288 [Tuber brumale]